MLVLEEDLKIRVRQAPAWQAIRRNLIDDYLDAGHGCCALTKPEMARPNDVRVIEKDFLMKVRRYDLIPGVLCTHGMSNEPKIIQK